MTAERPNIVTMATGLVLIGLGILLLLATHGLITIRQVVQLWPAGIVVMGSATLWQALRGGESARHIPVAGLLWLVALGMLFSYTFDRRGVSDTEPDGSINVFSVLREQHPAITGAFHGAKITAVMGGTNVDLRKASVAPDETVVLDVFAVWGGGDIRVPRDWDVSIQTNTLMGAVKDQRGARPKGGADASIDPASSGTASTAGLAPPHLVLRGNVVMGGFTIKP